MKRLVLLLILGGLMLSCAGLPTLQQPAGPDSAKENPACQAFYPRGKWQLLHTIEAELPGNRKGFLMGVTRLSSQERSARCVIMTLEGFVLLDARYDGEVKIERAVAPFDNPAFAQGVMADIRLIFFKPMADETTTGKLADGATVCRHRLADGHVIDITQRGDMLWETRLYGSNHRLKRIVKGMCKENPPMGASWGIADKIELTALERPGYKLALDLVEAIPIGPEDSRDQGVE